MVCAVLIFVFGVAMLVAGAILESRNAFESIRQSGSYTIGDDRRIVGHVEKRITCTSEQWERVEKESQ
jgi:hypothetical protein